MHAFIARFLHEFEALSLALLPIVGLWFAYQQVMIARAKFQHDLFDRRFAVFEAARKFLSQIATDGEASETSILAYTLGTIDAEFLLGPDVHEYLREIRSKAIDLMAAKETFRPMPVGPERTALVQKSANLLMWMVAQFDPLRDKFRPFLSLREPPWLAGQ